MTRRVDFSDRIAAHTRALNSNPMHLVLVGVAVLLLAAMMSFYVNVLFAHLDQAAALHARMRLAQAPIARAALRPVATVAPLRLAQVAQ